jgi:cytochrome c oxidase subunit III
MKVGTIELTDQKRELERSRSIGRTGGSGGGNGRGRDPGSGGDRPDGGDKLEADRFVPGKSRIFTGFLLVVVLMTFGGLSTAYVVIQTNRVAEWRPFDLPIQIWISTVLIVLSSVTYQIGKVAVDRNDQPRAKKWLIATTVLGAAFISSQILAWLQLVAMGLYVRGNPYAGFFYILTAVHAVHVLGGVIALGSILLRVWYPTADANEVLRRTTVAEVVGWYWHFMGAIWLVLFILLGFWK